MIVLIQVPHPQKIMWLLPHIMPLTTALHEIVCLEVMSQLNYVVTISLCV
jgi:hypothetical protein